MQNKLLTEYWTEAKENSERRRQQGKPEYPTGLSFLDEATDGLHKGEIWVVGGKAGSGKTSLALGMSKSFAENPDHSILLASLEMKGYELVTRMFSEMMNVDFMDFTKGILPPGFKEKDERFRDYLKAINLEIAEYVGYKFEEIEKLIKEGYDNKKLDILVLDFIQLVDKKDFRDERHALEAYTRKLKELAKKENVGIIIVSQLRRLPSGADYNREPDIIDLLGTGSLEQIADKVVLVYKAKDKEENLHYFINLAKNRQGQTIKEEVIFEGQYYRFKDMPFPVQAGVLKKEFQGKYV